MKKNIFLYIFLFLSIAKIQTSFGFLSDPLGLDLYEKIDKGVYELDLKYIEKELKGGDVNGSIKEQLEKIEKVEEGSKIASCYSADFTSEEIKKIATIEDSNELLYKKLENCSVDGAIDALTFAEYHDKIKKYYNDAKESADNKTKQITKISRIGLYSDGVEENSPFDLIVDLKDIDKIIFETETPYNGVNMEDMGVVVDSELAGNYLDDAWVLGSYKDVITYDFDDDNNIIVAPNKNIQPIKIVDGSNSVCRINDSGLNDEIFDNIGSGTTSTLTGNTDAGDFFPDLPNNNNNNIEYDEYGNPIWSYERVDDSDGWPCNDFFCITIEFVTHSQNLLSFGKSRSIEGFLKKSNKDLKKFAGTSLAQGKMTTNNFEFGLKDLNLPDLFHVGVQIMSKPAPILNLDKVNKDESSNKKEDNSDFSSENLLYRYYKNLGLDYERRNDLEVFNQEDEELKALIDNTGLPSVAAEESYNELNAFRKMIALENNYLSETVIDKKILEDDVSDFYNQFIELETFSKAMMEYTINLSSIIRNMRSIPINN